MADGSHVSELLAEVFRRGGMKRAVRRAEAVLLWPQVVGPEVARFSEAKALRDGVLYVEVPDSETSMHLSLQRQRFLDVYRGRFGVKEVRDIRFRMGRTRPPEEAEPPPPTARPDPKALAKLARDLGELELPDELAGPAMQAARAMLAFRARKEAEGWRPCRTCGVLAPEGPLCVTCRRYAADRRVEAASHRLAVDPTEATPLLSDDERHVAVHLAERYLHDTLAELLPQVLADPTFKPQLERAARCLLALRRGVAPDQLGDEDWARLDARVARALGRWG